MIIRDHNYFLKALDKEFVFIIGKITTILYILLKVSHFVFVFKIKGN